MQSPRKGLSARETVGKILLSQGNQTPDGVVKEHQNLTNPSSTATTRTFENTVYDLAYERAGIPIDPHLRLFYGKSVKRAGPSKL